MLKYDFWQHPRSPLRAVDIMLTPNQMHKLDAVLSKHGMSHTAMIQDVGELMNQQQKSSKRTTENRALNSISDFDYTVYHSLADVWTLLR